MLIKLLQCGQRGRKICVEGENQRKDRWSDLGFEMLVLGSPLSPKVSHLPTNSLFHLINSFIWLERVLLCWTSRDICLVSRLTLWVLESFSFKGLRSEIKAQDTSTCIRCDGRVFVHSPGWYHSPAPSVKTLPQPSSLSWSGEKRVTKLVAPSIGSLLFHQYATHRFLSLFWWNLHSL